MRTRAALLIGGAVGYLLGTRAGREQLETVREQLETVREQARRAWADPRVQDVVADGQQRATQFVKDHAPEVRDLVTGAVRSVSEVRHGDQGPTGA